LWDVNDLFEYWRDYPPTHVLVAAYLTGGKHVSTTKDHGKSANKLEELTRTVVGMGGSITNKLPQIYRV